MKRAKQKSGGTFVARCVVLVLIAAIGSFIAWNWYGWHRMGRGYEVKPETKASFLKSRISEDLGYDGFDPAWLQKAWMNGLRIILTFF